MSIDTLHVLPQMTHDADLGGYAYPNEYRNKLYISKDQYIFIKQNSYDTFPKNILDTIVQSVVLNSEPSQPIDEDIIRAIISDELSKLNQSNEEADVSSKVYEIIDERIKNQTIEQVDNFIDRITTVVAEYQEKTKDLLDEKASIESLTVFHEQVVNLINEKTSMPIPKFNNAQSYDSIKDIISTELKIVYDNMERVISEKVLEHMTTLSIKGKSENGETKQVPVTKLAMLKESGFTVDEIIQLVKSGSI